ncbi:MAG: efflux RND transporter periplasmic adaptor subunit [Acidobacteria bacterium]|nr:efflux RND transporter periplasmic adaptor subunit [Acidobacteriota bacterium]
MKKIVVVALLVAGSAGAWYFTRSQGVAGAAGSGSATGAPGATGAGGGRGSGRPALTVDTAPAIRHEVTEYVTVVGNLIGNATVDIVPRVAGRLDSITAKLGDRVSRGQQIAKIEDRELQQQVKQVEQNVLVNNATVTQRESDLQLRKTTLDRQKELLSRGLATRQTIEDAEAAHNSAVAAVELAKAQLGQTQARLDELKITLSNTNIVSPVDGFIGRRNLDQGAFAGANTAIVSVVDIATVRLISNLVEKDFKRVNAGVTALIEVDAFPGEQFTGTVSRVAPVFDSATRTASMEIEVPNPGYRLKPGMFARVKLTVEVRPDALTVPRNAVVDSEGQRGVFLVDGQSAKFQPVTTGLQDNERIEILSGLTEGTRVITTGALALRSGDRITPMNMPGQRGGRSGGRTGGGPEGSTTPAPGAPAGRGGGL